MPDWKKFVRGQMANLDLPNEERDEVVTELAAHLEDSYADPLPGEDSIPSTHAWRRLSRAIQQAKTEEGFMNPRIRSLWLPIFANLTAAVALTLVLDHFNFGEPGIATTGHVAKAFRVPWLLPLPVLGALGALLARRAQASRRQRLIAGLAPALLWLVVIVILGLFLSLNPRHFAGVSIADFALSLLGLVIFPACALFLGTLPFLGEQDRQTQEERTQ